MYAAKQPLAARITVEEGVMSEDDAIQKLDLVIAEVVAHLDA